LPEGEAQLAPDAAPDATEEPAPAAEAEAEPAPVEEAPAAPEPAPAEEPQEVEEAAAEEEVTPQAAEPSPPPAPVAAAPPTPAAPRTAEAVEELSFAGDWAAAAEGAEVDLCLFALLNELAEEVDAEVSAPPTSALCPNPILPSSAARAGDRFWSTPGAAQTQTHVCIVRHRSMPIAPPTLPSAAPLTLCLSVQEAEAAAAAKKALEPKVQVPMTDVPTDCPRCCSHGASHTLTRLAGGGLPSQLKAAAQCLPRSADVVLSLVLVAPSPLPPRRVQQWPR
jgi:hypothetical protein